MKTRALFFSMSLMAAVISGQGAQAATVQADQQALATALKAHLAQHGDFCLGKFNWPIDVSWHEVEVGTRDAVQMPVLEKLGLVASTMASVRRLVGDTEQTVEVKRYSLTDAGQKFYLNTAPDTLDASGLPVARQGDLCAGKVSLDKVVRWEAPEATYTYRFAAVPWGHDPEVLKAFPMLARLVQGEGTLELKQRFQLKDGQWVPVNPLASR